MNIIQSSSLPFYNKDVLSYTFQPFFPHFYLRSHEISLFCPYFEEHSIQDHLRGGLRTMRASLQPFSSSEPSNSITLNSPFMTIQAVSKISPKLFQTLPVTQFQNCFYIFNSLLQQHPTSQAVTFILVHILNLVNYEDQKCVSHNSGG